jgi:hypothetical protein
MGCETCLHAGPTSRALCMSCWLKDSTIEATLGISLAFRASTMPVTRSAISWPVSCLPPTTLGWARLVISCLQPEAAVGE